MERFAREIGVFYLRLEVDDFNDEAISNYEGKGFYSLGSRETFENVARIIMRKDLLNCE